MTRLSILLDRLEHADGRPPNALRVLVRLGYGRHRCPNAADCPSAGHPAPLY